MKKFLFAALGAGLLMTSCQSDEPFAPGNGTAQQVAFTVSLPDAVSTRAGGTNSAAGGVSNNVGANVTFNVALYLIGGSETEPVYTASDVVSSTGNHTSATFEPTLVIGEQYRVVAYAKFDDDTLNEELTAINVTPEINNEQKDEYFANTIVTAAPELSATLKRPFGKLRLIAEDLAEAERQFGAKVESIEVTYKHTRPTNFNVIAGTFDPAYTEGAQKFAAAYGEYSNETDAARTIFVDYLPGKFDGTESMVPFTVTVKFVGGKTYTRDFNQDIPVKRNHLTTLKGRLFTIDSDLTLTIEEGFEGETQSNFANDLEWVAANGGTVNLTEDITLTEALNVTKDMVINLDEDVTINGNINVAEGVNLTVNGGEIINTNDAVSGITSNGDLTLNDVEITSARHAIRVESGKAVINGGVYKVVPTSNKTLHALNVGDNGTTAEVIIKGGTFIGPKGTMADSGSAVNVRSGSTVAIEGGDFSGGKSKTLANGGTLTVTGGSFDQNPTAFVANGYKAIAKDGKYYVVPEEADAVATTAEELREALKDSQNVVLYADVFTTDAESNGYGATGINVNGGIFDGNGYKLVVEGATSTWDSAVAIKGGTIKNLTVAKGFRGIFIKNGTEKVVLENVVVDGPTYTISCDSAGKQGIEAYNSTFNGWTSYAGTIGTAKFVGCSFGKGAGYNFSRPYAPTEYVNCNFAEGHAIDACAAVTFKNCTFNGVALTADNLATLVVGGRDKATVK